MGKGKELSKDAISAGDQPQPGSELRRASGITVHRALRQGGSSVSASHWAAWSAGQDSQASQGGVAPEPGAGLRRSQGVTCKHSKLGLWGLVHLPVQSNWDLGRAPPASIRVATTHLSEGLT